MKKLYGVTAHHLVLFLLRHAGEISFDHIHGLGPVRLLVRKIGAPDKTIDINLVAQLDANPIELKTPQTVLADVFARGPRQRPEAQKSLRPTIMAIITHI